MCGKKLHFTFLFLVLVSLQQTLAKSVQKPSHPKTMPDQTKWNKWLLHHQKPGQNKTQLVKNNMIFKDSKGKPEKVNATAGACYAAPLTWGQECKGASAIFGSSTARVRYSVKLQAHQVKTLVRCDAWGCFNDLTPNCQLGWQSIGCGYDAWSWVLFWGSNIDYPWIVCYGNPTGVYYQWSY